MAVAEIDRTTGFQRRPSFLVLLDEYLAAARHAERPLSLLALNVDHLAYINYCYSPAAGEAALGMAATVLRAHIRDEMLAHFGDEFFALLPDMELAEAIDLAERVRRAAVIVPIPDPQTGKPRRCLSFSLAVAAYPESADDAATLLRLVSEGLIQAKRLGRDTVYRAIASHGP